MNIMKHFNIRSENVWTYMICMNGNPISRFYDGYIDYCKDHLKTISKMSKDEFILIPYDENKWNNKKSHCLYKKLNNYIDLL